MEYWRLRVPLHPTWHFTLLCIGVVIGLGVSQYTWTAIFASPVWILVSLSLCGFVYWKRWAWLFSLALVAGALIGMMRGSIDQVDRHQYTGLYGNRVVVTGKVSEDVDIGKRGQTIVRLGNIRYGDRNLVGKLWVTIDQENSIQRSDIIEIEGQLEAGFGSFVGSIYRADIVSVKRPQPGDVALTVREDFGQKVRLGISEPAASLGMGYLTGQRRSLPPELDEALQLAGLTHIVVASGYNLTILVRMIKRLFEKRSRYLTVFLSSLLIVGFIAVTGSSPSMSRAGLVAGLALAAWYFGRKFHPITLLAFAAAVTGLIDPSYVWGNLGWQLSFAAFAGVMIVAPLMQNYFFGDKKPGKIRQILGETVSAQLVTAPLLLYSFGQISNVAIIANLLVLPLVPLAMLLTWVTGLAGYLVPMLVGLIALPAQWLLSYMVTVATTTAHLPWAQAEYELSAAGLVLCFGLIVAACWWMQRATKYKLRDSNIIE